MLSPNAVGGGTGAGRSGLPPTGYSDCWPHRCGSGELSGELPLLAEVRQPRLAYRTQSEPTALAPSGKAEYAIKGVDAHSLSDAAICRLLQGAELCSMMRPCPST